jgi:hypothetical protein
MPVGDLPKLEACLYGKKKDEKMKIEKLLESGFMFVFLLLHFY